MVTAVESHTIDTLLLEERRYPPPPDFASQANATSDVYSRGFEQFWEAEGRDRVTWFEPFSRLLEWELPYAKWYLGGRLNVCFNCVDRHEITFSQLQREVVRFANALKELGVGRGTPVAIYMGMVPELPVAMLACTRLGAPHTVVFGGFSADSLSSRMNDMECEVLVTQDAGWRKGGEVPLKKTADVAMADAPGVKRCLVVHRKDADVEMQEGRDVWYHELAEGVPDDPDSCACEPMDSEDLLFLMYT